MPIFEFACTECNHEFESLSKPHEPVECPKCKARESHSFVDGKIVKKFSVTSPHQWKCSSAGAAPRRGR